MSRNETKSDRAVAEVNSYLKTNDLKAVPFDKGAGFRLMSNQYYHSKLSGISKGVQFEKRTDLQGDFVVKFDAKFNQNLKVPYDTGKLPRDVYGPVRFWPVDWPGFRILPKCTRKIYLSDRFFHTLGVAMTSSPAT